RLLGLGRVDVRDIRGVRGAGDGRAGRVRIGGAHKVLVFRCLRCLNVKNYTGLGDETAYRRPASGTFTALITVAPARRLAPAAMNHQSTTVIWVFHDVMASPKNKTVMMDSTP